MKLEATINDIIQTLEDGHKGFASAAEMAEKDGRQDLALEFRQYSEQRAMFSNELRNHGHDPGHRATRTELEEFLLDVLVATEDRSQPREALW